MSDAYSAAERLLRRASRAATLAVLAGAVVLYVGFREGRPLALGLIVGGAASILRYRMRYRALVRLPDAGAGVLVRARLLGYLLSGAALAVAFLLRRTISPWSAIAGLFVMNGCILAVELFSRDRELAGGKAVTEKND